MTHQTFPSPSINPLQRLHVYDSLMMNAERWRLAHYYHRHRQNIHYQSLNEPGVVCGLGVRVVAPPDDAPAKFRDQRWVEIQPGIAIDIEGNPIIVDSSIDRKFRISTAAPMTGSVTVYLVTSYVEPQNPGLRQSSDLIREWFRFDEKTSPPNEKEIELCRIRLSPGTVQLENPTDVLFPKVNQLDLRFRTQVQARPQSIVRLATTLNVSDRTFHNLSYLMQSVEVLYPALQGVTTVGQINLSTEVNDYDLVYLTGWQALHLEPAELDALRQYLQTGGVIFIEVSSQSSKLTPDIKDLIAYKFQTTMQSWQNLNNQHPLRTQPFLFAALRNINKQNIQLSNGGGIILLEGDLSDAWGIDNNSILERNDIRTAQELGINILNFALQRRKITQQLS